MRIVYENNHVPQVGRYKNAVVDDPAAGKNWLYDSQGSYVVLNKKGDPGPALPGGGLPSGGTTGQVLAKTSSTNFATTWKTIVPSDIGLGNVDNTSDATKFFNAALTGAPTAPTAAPGTNTTQLATTEFVTAAVAAGGGGGGGGGGAYLPLTGGNLTGNLNITLSDGTDASFGVTNRSANKGVYLSLLANGGTNPFMGITGLSGAGTDPNTWRLLWRFGNFSTTGFTIFTNSNGGVGYPILPATSWDYSQNMTVYGNILPSVINSKTVGSASLPFLTVYSSKVIFNTGANIDGGLLGRMTFNGSIRIPTGATAGYVLTSDGIGLATWKPAGTAISDATFSNKGTVKLNADLAGSADSPLVVNAHFTKNGFVMTAPDGGKWLITIDNSGDWVRTSIPSGSGSGEPIGLLLGLTRA